jgi:hypothetical protein
VNREYGPHSRQSIRILLEHFGYRGEFNVYEAADKIAEWFRGHFVTVDRDDVVRRILYEVNTIE